ncbi:MAG: PP2C family protein-serine/threonine phosphatase, partial [Candidatus Zixiibacteriota bacterium]
NASGNIQAHSDDIRNIRKPFQIPDNIDINKIGNPQLLSEKDDTLNYLITPIMIGENRIGNVHVTYSTAMINNKLAASRKKIIPLLVILIFLGIVGIYLLSNYFVTPILKITYRVRKFTSGDLETELPLEGAEEFFEISRAFNQMITRLSQDRKNIAEREKLAKEIEVASEIQKTLMPIKLPTLPKLEIDSFYRAASVIGGDLYDVFKVSEDRYCLVVADVSGKGVPASLVMSMLKTVIQINALHAASAKSVLIKVNNYLKENIPPGIFITVFMVIYNSATRTINAVSAGHNPMLFFSAEQNKIIKINPKGMPLGMPVTREPSFEKRLEEIDIKMNDGDLFFIYTDGITEATDRDSNQYGLERLVNLLETSLVKKKVKDIPSFSKYIINEIEDFTGFVKANDDIAFILARCQLNPEPDKSTPEKADSPKTIAITTVNNSQPT